MKTGDSFVLPRGIARHRYIVSSSLSASQPLHQGVWRKWAALNPCCQIARCFVAPAGLTARKAGTDAFDVLHLRLADRKVGPRHRDPKSFASRRERTDGFLKDPFLGLDVETEDAGKPGFQTRPTLSRSKAFRSYALRDGGRSRWARGLPWPTPIFPVPSAPSTMAPVNLGCLRDEHVLAFRVTFSMLLQGSNGPDPDGSHLRSWRIHMAARIARRTVDCFVHSL